MYSTTSEVILLIFITVFISIMITFIVKILFFVQKKQKSFLIHLKEAKTNYERELYKAHLEIQEQTSQEIAREIHDDVGQGLSLAKLGLSTLDFMRTEEAKDSIVEISDILEQALDSLRNISRTMNSEIIIKGGLKKSIDMQVGFIQRGGKFKINFLVNGECVLFDEKKDIVLFRIVQQALNNIIRHSEATEISITLTYLSNLLKLQIEDNGKGFNLEEKFSGPNQVSGIYNMQRRAKLIDAEFDLESKIGSGTRITVTTPY
jgi:two-component system, NarL family, sensor kinase